MAVDTSIIAFTAFEDQLRTLCLNEFPCGIGPWRENYRKNISIIEKEKVKCRFAVTLKSYGGNHEKTETLEELVRVKFSPWNGDYSWSDEARELREISVKSPWLIDDKFVLAHFKTLRIIDKNVAELDEALKSLKNLEELTLTANYLRTVNSENLPRRLKVLELCANQISNLADLCMNPPPILMHLGLGHNLLTMVDDYITGNFWPELLSLDLSYNNLGDIMDIVKKLKSLPMLRNLVLQGNPLYLIPGYRGFVVDNLRKLLILDDLHISADERHDYRGLAKRKDQIIDEARFRFQVSNIKGIPMPEEVRCSEDLPEFPIITKKYFIRFMFPEERKNNTELLQFLQNAELVSSPEPMTEAPPGGDQQQTPSIVKSQLSISTPKKSILATSSAHTVDKSVAFVGSGNNQSQKDDTEQGGSLPRSSPSNFGELMQEPDNLLFPDPQDMNGNEPQLVKVAPLDSARGEWAENIEVNWSQDTVRDDLLGLRNFLKEDMEIMVMEEKVLSYPPEEEDGQSPTPSGKGGKKDKGKKDDKGKDAKDKGKKKDAKKKDAPPNKDGKKKKKKGEPDIDLVHMPPEYRTIATFQVPMEDFLMGDDNYKKVFTKDISELDESFRADSVAESIQKKEGADKKKKKGKGKGKGKDKGKDKEKDKKKPGSAKKEDPKKKEKDARGKSPKGDKKGKKGKDGGATDDEEPLPPPPPIEFDISLTLERWKCASEADHKHEETDAALAIPK